MRDRMHPSVKTGMTGIVPQGLAERARLALAIVCTALVLLMLAAVLQPAAAADQEEANRLIVQSVKLHNIAAASEDLETRAANLQRVLENLQRIVDVLAGSDHAVTLVAGEQVAGLSIPDIRHELAQVQGELDALRATQPGAVYEYHAPALYSAAIYETSKGDPFISVVTAVSGMNLQYTTVNHESFIDERWTSVCWDYLGEEGQWSQTQEFQFDCRQLFPATLGQQFQIVSETTLDTGKRLSEVWDVEVTYYERDEDFGHLVSFAGPLERITGNERERVMQQHVYSAGTGLISRIVFDADADTGEGGDVIEAVEYHELGSRAVADLVIGCSRQGSGVERLQECVCGARFFERTLGPDDLARFAQIMTARAEQAAENAEFMSAIEARMPELKDECD